ncbi:GntR family transcriptional regulator [Nonomuraea sp. NPDC050022]|uniref:GntR family transcriptional regulator n=1 Tax=Nonomuraea sp. NPDC050022 TaxID=3364358 RepID=UPI00379AF634
MVELRANRPRWRQVHAIIVVRIRTGEYKAGERIPSLIALIEEFGIANATGQKVMRALRADGLIRTEPGMGSFVTTPEERQAVEGQ